MIISIHALREEGDFSTLAQVMATQGISIHALREEGDALIRGQEQFPADFYPRPPRGGRLSHMPRGHTQGYFYPRPPRGGRRAAFGVDHQRPRISIHALREEGGWPARTRRGSA